MSAGGGGADDGATRLGAEEQDALIPRHLVTRDDLNEWEQANILKATPWLGRQRDILTPESARELHRRMFDETWRWAGELRRSDTNIGVPWPTIGVQLRDLMADVRHQVAQGSHGIDEIGARFHHRLVQIHAFPNGNGRHARLLTDRLMQLLGATPFTWGSASLDRQGGARDRYLAALREADRGRIGALLAFVRT